MMLHLIIAKERFLRKNILTLKSNLVFLVSIIFIYLGSAISAQNSSSEDPRGADKSKLRAHPTNANSHDDDSNTLEEEILVEELVLEEEPEIDLGRSLLDEIPKEKEEDKFDVFSMTARFGYLNGTVNELVYDNNAGHNPLESRLIWNMGSQLTAELAFQLRLKYLVFQAAIALPLFNVFDSVTMTNQDWLYDNFNISPSLHNLQSNFSSHSSVIQNLAIQGNLKLAYRHELRKAIEILFGLNIDIKHWSWTANGGRAIYYITGATYSPSILNLEGDLIRYDFTMLAIAPMLQVDFFIGNFYEINLMLAYSPLTIVVDQDIHYLRSILFQDISFTGQYITGSLLNRFWLSKYLALDLLASFHWMGETAANTISYSYVNNTRGNQLSSTNGAAGFTYLEAKIYLGLSLGFPKRQAEKDTELKNKELEEAGAELEEGIS